MRQTYSNHVLQASDWVMAPSALLDLVWRLRRGPSPKPSGHDEKSATGQRLPPPRDQISSRESSAFFLASSILRFSSSKAPVP